jgi:ribosome-binding factor A
MEHRHAQLTRLLAEHAAHFVSRESNRRSLITITRTDLSQKLDRVTFYVHILPEDAEGAALGFLLRNRGECRAHLKKHVPMKKVPHVEFAIDEGEKHRQKLDELLS